jgi:hypothetical protein
MTLITCYFFFFFIKNTYILHLSSFTNKTYFPSITKKVRGIDSVYSIPCMYLVHFFRDIWVMKQENKMITEIITFGFLAY